MKLKCGKANVCAVPKECKRTDVYYFEIELTKGQQETDRNVYYVLGFFYKRLFMQMRCDGQKHEKLGLLCTLHVVFDNNRH